MVWPGTNWSGIGLEKDHRGQNPGSSTVLLAGGSLACWLVWPWPAWQKSSGVSGRTEQKK